MSPKNLLMFSDRKIMSPSDVTTVMKPSRDLRYRLSICRSSSHSLLLPLLPLLQPGGNNHNNSEHNQTDSGGTFVFLFHFQSLPSFLPLLTKSTDKLLSSALPRPRRRRRRGGREEQPNIGARKKKGKKKGVFVFVLCSSAWNKAQRPPRVEALAVPPACFPR